MRHVTSEGEIMGGHSPQREYRITKKRYQYQSGKQQIDKSKLESRLAGKNYKFEYRNGVLQKQSIQD